jgi:hypothetical protein
LKSATGGRLRPIAMLEEFGIPTLVLCSWRSINSHWVYRFQELIGAAVVAEAGCRFKEDRMKHLKINCNIELYK